MKCLLCKCEDLGLMPRIHVKMLGAMAQTCSPSTEEVEIGRYLGLSGLVP